MASESGLGRIDEVIHVANAYIDTNNYERAREVLSRALSHNPNDPSLLSSYARAEIALANYSSAARSAYAALSAAPDDQFAMRLYALSLHCLGRHHDGLWMAWRAVEAHPNEPAPLRLYALLLQKARQLRSALVAIDEALRLDPQHVDAHIRRGSILHDMGLRAESDASYRAALQLDPANGEALTGLAVHKLERNKLGRAVHGFLGAARSAPELADLARRNIGVVLRRVLIWVTVGTTVLGVLVALTAGSRVAGQPTATLRLGAGIVTAALVTTLSWLWRAIPRGVLLSLLRKQHFVAARAVHAVVAIVAGAWITVFPGPPAMVAVGALLAISALIISRIGLSIGK